MQFGVTREYYEQKKDVFRETLKSERDYGLVIP